MRNELYPIFLKVSQLNTTIVGGGNVGLEKLSFLVKSSPNAKVVIVSKDFLPALVDLASKHDVELKTKAYDASDLDGVHMVIAATDDVEVNKQVYRDAKAKQLLVNVADTPEYCDFYLGGIVTKGNVKVGISTNGKSPTMAKRLRQLFEEVLPEDIDELAENLNKYRDTLKGDFEFKVDEMNKITKGLIDKDD